MTSAQIAETLLKNASDGDVMAANCPSRAILLHVTSRWGTLVLISLLGGVQRFSQIKRRVGGISERMLSHTLQVLEKDGLLVRHSHDVVPPHVEYRLTELGQEIGERVMGLSVWIETNLPRLLAAQNF